MFKFIYGYHFEPIYELTQRRSVHLSVDLTNIMIISLTQ